MVNAKDVKIKQRDRLKKIIGEQDDRQLQEELFYRLEDFEVKKLKDNQMLFNVKKQQLLKLKFSYRILQDKLDTKEITHN